MDYEFEQDPESRYPLVGLLTGLITVVINFIFNFSYRAATGFESYDVVNIATMAYGSLIPLTASGILYYLLDKVKGGHFLYRLIFVCLFTYLTYSCFSLRLYNDPVTDYHFHQLLAGIMLITGISGTFLLPFLVAHKNLTRKII